MSSDIDIKLTSQFTGKKAFKEAESSISKLGTSAKNLAKTFGVSLAAAAFVKYSKASMRAAAQDQKSQALLANSLNNLGLAYAKVDVEGFISSLETQTAIADDVLRPSFAKLAQVTGSVTISQDLMKLAFDAAAGSGLDYAQTVDILSQAYIGNTKGLKALNLGLTAAELKAMSFNEIQKKIQATFSGSGASSLETYQGQMDKLAIATGNASEKIGYALLGSIIKISGSKDVDGLIIKINALASAFASVVTQVGNAVGALTGNETRKAFSPAFAISGGRAGTFTVPRTGAGNLQLTGGSNMDTQRSQIELAKKAEKLAKNRNALLAIDNALTTRKITLTADQQALEELKKKFDVERVGLYAALNQATDEETKGRILSLIAIHDNDAALAGKIKAEEEAAKTAALLGSALYKLSAEFDMERARMALGKAEVANTAAIASSAAPYPTGSMTPSIAAQDSLGNYMDAARTAAARGGIYNTISLNIQGSVTTERDLVSAITQGIYNNQASGIPINYSTAY